MSFLIKVLILVAVVFMIPVDPSELARSGSAVRTVGVFDAYSLAQAVANDAGGFCGRNPAACDTGAALGDVLAAKARTVTRWAQDRLAPSTAKAPAEPDPTPHAPPHEATGSVVGMKPVHPVAPIPAQPPRKPAGIRQDT
jgi:hypothetical protein